MRFFQKYFIDVRRGEKIVFSENDLRKFDRTYEKEVFPEEPNRIHCAFRKVPQQAYLTQLRDYAFEKILHSNMYTFRYILVIPNPYGMVRQSALVLFQSHDKTKVRYRVVGDTPEADFCGETGYTTRHRVPIFGLYLGRNNQVELEMLDLDGNVVKRRTLCIYVPDAPKGIKKVHLENSGKNLSYFPFIMLNSVSRHPYAVDVNGTVRYSIQLWTTNIGMLPLSNGHFLYEDRTANRLNQRGRIKSCRYHEMDYMGRVYRTFLLDASIRGIAAQSGELLFLRALSGRTGKRCCIQLNLKTGEVLERKGVPARFKENAGKEVCSFLNLKRKGQETSARRILSKDGKRALTCVNVQDQKMAELVETDCATGQMTVQRVLNMPVKKLWLFEPDIPDFCRPVSMDKKVVFGEIAPPAVFEGKLPEQESERIDRDYFGNIRLCGDLLIAAILPNRVSCVYLVGKGHAYVQDYSGMLNTGRKRFPFAISLSGLAADEYCIYVESQNIAYPLKRKIRITEEPEE